MILYNRFERSHIAPKTRTDSGSSGDLLNPVRLGSMLASSANSRGTVGFGTRDGSKYEKAEILRNKKNSVSVFGFRRLGTRVALTSQNNRCPKAHAKTLFVPCGYILGL
jgi:hypothetical protein